ncbi:MAG: PTS transporter subunit EIIC [Enterocloster bolteae]
MGIISGFAGGVIYNKYYNYRKLPDALAFFNGKRFVPMVVILWSVIISLVLAIVWPVVQTGINSFGVWIANSSSTSPVLAPFIYGTLERLLLPFGLHHMLTIPMNYTSFGGTYTILTGVNAGSQVFGQDPLWLAWATDLINLKDAGDMAGYQNLLATITPARFKVGQMIGATGLLLGIALAMYRRVDPDKRRNYRSMFISTVPGRISHRCHRASGIHVYVLRPSAVSGIRSAAGMRFCHGRPHPPQASFLWQPGIPDPCSHVHPRRTWRRPGKLHPLCGCILCRRIRHRLFYDRKVPFCHPGQTGQLYRRLPPQRTARAGPVLHHPVTARPDASSPFWAAGITLSWWTPA